MRAVETGMRASDGLLMSDFDFEHGLVSVRQSVWRGKFQSPKSENAVRCFSLSSRLLAHIGEFLKRLKPNAGDHMLSVAPTPPVKWRLMVINFGSGSYQAPSVQTGRRASSPRLHQHSARLDRTRAARLPFAAAIRFGETAGLLTRADVLRLRRRTPDMELRRLRELRALLKRTFQTRLLGLEPGSTDLEKLSADLAKAARATRLMVVTQTTRSSEQVPMRREITGEKAGDALLRLRIVEAAVALLISDAMLKVKACPTCGWLFLDVSKNQSRRWYSMDTCGAVAKARRYYRRLKERADR